MFRVKTARITSRTTFLKADGLFLLKNILARHVSSRRGQGGREEGGGRGSLQDGHDQLPAMTITYSLLLLQRLLELQGMARVRGLQSVMEEGGLQNVIQASQGDVGWEGGRGGILEEDLRLVVGREGGVEDIIAVLLEFAGDLQVQTIGCGVLWLLGLPGGVSISLMRRWFVCVRVCVCVCVCVLFIFVDILGSVGTAWWGVSPAFAQMVCVCVCVCVYVRVLFVFIGMRGFI